MRRADIHMSNGAWIFASAVAVAIIAPGVYAASSSIVSIGNPNNNATALVTTGTRQLQTVTTAPGNLVHTWKGVPNGGCTPVYTPPAGKAIVVTQVTFSAGSGAQGSENFGGVFGPGCSSGSQFDMFDTVQAYESESRTYPTGVPLAGVAAFSSGGYSWVFVSGYLIPAANLPPEAPQVSGPSKVLAVH